MLRCWVLMSENQVSELVCLVLGLYEGLMLQCWVLMSERQVVCLVL